MYRQFNIKQLYVLPTQCIYVFCMDLRTNRLFPYTALTDWYQVYSVFSTKQDLNMQIIFEGLRAADRQKYFILRKVNNAACDNTQHPRAWWLFGDEQEGMCKDAAVV